MGRLVVVMRVVLEGNKRHGVPLEAARISEACAPETVDHPLAISSLRNKRGCGEGGACWTIMKDGGNHEDLASFCMS